MVGVFFIWGFFFLSYVEAIDRENFRTCGDLAFCRRYRKFQSLPVRAKVLAGRRSEMPTGWRHGGLRFPLRREHEEDWSLVFGVEIYENDVARLLIEDMHGNHTRHVVETEISRSEISSFSVVEESEISRVSTETGLAVEVVHIPEEFSVRIFRDGNLLQTLNARKMLNFERQRPPGTGERCSSLVREEISDPAIDAVCHPGVSAEETKAAWEDEWRGSVDRKFLGPMAVGFDFRFHGASFAYGLPEHATSLVLPMDRDVRLFNLDVFEYPLDEPEISLYGSVPLLTAVHGNLLEEEISSAIFVANAADSVWRLSENMHIPIRRGEVSDLDVSGVFESGRLEMFVWSGLDGSEILRKYFQVTGKPEMPGLWSLGYHQCRWNYETSEDVLNVSGNFSALGIPLEVMWLDIEYSAGKKYFEWDDRKFPPPQSEMIENLEAEGRRLVVIVDPHVKKEEGFFVYEEMKSGNLLVKNSDQISDFNGDCWPGDSVYPDFFREEARKLWGEYWMKFPGISDRTMLWNDMNEPSVFSGPELTMPKNLVHFLPEKNTKKTPEKNTRSGLVPVEHREIHNQYGQVYVKGSWEGLVRRSSQIPFILTRSFFAGSHRLRGVATWTGDNAAKWNHLEISFDMLLNAAVGGGMNFVGADVGGFFGHPEKELFIRWHQVGAMAYPFYRSHAHLKSPRREPWKYDEETLQIVRETISERYRLLLFWYASFKVLTEFGRPVIAPLFFFDPEIGRKNFRKKRQGALVVGDTLLVQMVAQPMARIAARKKISTDRDKLQFPGKPSDWFDYWTGERMSEEILGKAEIVLQRIPVYARAGKIVIYREVARRSSVFMRKDPVTLKIFLDENFLASGFGYFDDEETRDSKSSFVKFQVTQGALQVSPALGESKSLLQFPGPLIDRVEIFGLDRNAVGMIVRLTEDGEAEKALHSFRNGNAWVIKKPNVSTTDTSWKLHFSLAHESAESTVVESS